MIVTVTPNPSIDRTVTLPGALVRGAVHRVGKVTVEPGGKGVNVARALTLAGLDVVAVLPAGESDPILAGLRAIGVDVHAIPIAAAVRTNVAITEPDGARWVVLSGSLPPGLNDSWYSDVVAALQPLGCKVAVDTSDGPLAALAAGLERAAPDLIKPNSEELAGLAGVTLGPEFLRVPIAPTVDLDSHFRYLSGIFLGVGLIFYATIPAIERKTTLFRVAAALVALGGLARLVSLLSVGAPSVGHLVGLGLELVVVPLLAL